MMRLSNILAGFLLLLQFSITYAADMPDDRVLNEMAKFSPGTIAEMKNLYQRCDKTPEMIKEINFCATYDFVVEDIRLNDLYKDVLKNVHGTNAEKKLIKSQRAWLSFRDAVCAYETDAYSTGREGYAVEESCKTGRTKQRNEDLQRYLKCTTPGCPGEW